MKSSSAASILRVQARASPLPVSPGVLIELDAAGLLIITNTPAKTHGKYGTLETTFKIDPMVIGGLAAFLANLCAANGGRHIVTSRSKDAVCNALKDLGREAFPDLDVAITAYVFRHQKLADLKATFGAGPEVAAAAGHCTDRSQSAYGFVQDGRKLEGYISILATRAPRCGNVERGAQLANAMRRLRKKKQS